MKELKWMKGILYEVAFWRALYKRKVTRQWILNDAQLNHDIHLHNFDVAAFLRQRMAEGEEAPLVIDIGCGMSYFTGNILDGKEVNIHFIDPLAYFYNDILEREKAAAPRITFGMMEYLSAFYPERNASLAIIQNALDHSENPVKGIIQSLAVLRVGGVLYLKHYPNEAVKEQYRGFHQYNIDIEDGSYVIWNKEERHNVNELLRGFAEVEVSTYDHPSEVIAVVRKTAEVPDRLLTPLDDIRTLSSQLMLHARETHSLRNVASYHLRKPFLNTGQYLLRFVDLESKEKIKKLMRRFRK